MAEYTKGKNKWNHDQKPNGWSMEKEILNIFEILKKGTIMQNILKR